MVRLKEAEVMLRLSVVFILILSCFLLGLDTQTKEFAYIRKKVTFKDLVALQIGLYIDAVIAAYHMVQLGFGWLGVEHKKRSVSYKWLSYLFDQTAAYVALAGTTAAAQHSLLVVTGSKELQWMKWCNRFTRFCFQVGGAVVLSYLGVLLMLIISSLSAFHLFRLYSPSRFLRFKSCSS